MSLPTGLYEEIISASLKEQINKLENYYKQTKEIDPEEASLILSRYTGRVIQRALRIIREEIKNEDESLAEQVRTCNLLIEVLAKQIKNDDLLQYQIHHQHEMLLALYQKINTAKAQGNAPSPVRPETLISESTLFTGATTVEPNMVNEIKKSNYIFRRH